MPSIPKHLFYMTRALEQALTQGVEHWAADVDERSKWLSEGGDAKHILAGTMLVGCLAYSEGKLGPRWWKKMNSRAARRDIDILWIARNAFVHKDSIPKDLKSVSPDDLASIEAYCKELADGKILDDHGNVYPRYIELIGDNVVFKEHAIAIFARLFETTYRAFK